jgi:sucrose-phosphate synthase
MGLYIQMHSMHGLFRSENLELGRDEDTGGQIIYVRYLAQELAGLDEVDKVDIVVRRILDPEYPGYSEEIESLGPGVDIVRIECGPRQYLKKVDLWPFIDEFVENCKKYIKRIGRKPDILHSNYADSGLVCARLSKELGVPQIHTGHSLGKPKMSRIGYHDENAAEMEAIYHFNERLSAEQETIDNAAAIVVSTDEERLCQYNMYHVDINDPRFHVIPPGVNPDKFYPDGGEHEWSPEARKHLSELLASELAEPEKPMLFTMSRLEYRKNLVSLVNAYGFDEKLKEMANLVMVTGTLGKMGKNEQALMEEIMTAVERHGIEDKFCVIRHLEYKTEGGEIYRIVYESRGVFVNPAFHEPFGITILEAGATGVPVVATNNGGPEEILAQCKCGILVDPRDTGAIADACRRILTDPKLWQEFSDHGIQLVRRHYSWAAAARKELELFKEILAGQAG